MVTCKNRKKHPVQAQSRRVLVGLLVLLAPWVSLSAEQTRQAAVLLAGRPRLGEEASPFEPLICSSLETALAYSGLRVIRCGEAGGEAELLLEARSLQADYLLACEYVSRGELLDIELRWFDVGEYRESAFLAEQTRMGLSLDAVLGRLARDMIAAARPQIRIPLPAAATREPAEEAAAVFPAVPGVPTEKRPRPVEEPATEPGPKAAAAVQPAAETAVEPGVEAAVRSEPQPEAQPQPEVQPVVGPAVQPEAQPAVQPEVPAEPAGRRRALTLSFAAAPFLVDGLARDYLPSGYGLFPSLSLWYRWSFTNTYLGAGLTAGLNLFRTEGPLAFSDTALLPAGVEIRYGVDSRPVGLYVRLGGGPALFSIDPNDTGRLIKLTYYGQAGIGVTLPLGPAFGFVLDAGYLLFLEGQEEPIRGLAPSAGFYIRP